MHLNTISGRSSNLMSCRKSYRVSSPLVKLISIYSNSFGWNAWEKGCVNTILILLEGCASVGVKLQGVTLCWLLQEERLTKAKKWKFFLTRLSSWIVFGCLWKLRKGVLFTSAGIVALYVQCLFNTNFFSPFIFLQLLETYFLLHALELDRRFQWWNLTDHSNAIHSYQMNYSPHYQAACLSTMGYPISTPAAALEFF